MNEQNQNHIVEPTKKVSSIEWLLQELRKPYGDEYMKSIIEQAKAMHKDEIINAMSVAFMDGAKIGAINYTSPYKDWQQYYNETFQ
jgi:hypothetical protein